MGLKESFGDAFISRAHSVTVLFFLALSALGITTSSVGILGETSRWSESVKIFEPRQIRSDEFLRGSPVYLSLAQNGPSASIMDYSSALTSKPTGELIRQILSPDEFILKFLKSNLPLHISFAVNWWQYSIILFIFLPKLLSRIGVSPSLALLAPYLVFFSPTPQWWSLWPIVPVALCSTAAYFLLKSFDGTLSASRKSLAFFWSLSFAFRIPQTYLPWTIPVFLFFLLIIIGHCNVLSDRNKWIRFGISTMVIFLTVGAVKYTERQVLEVTLNTSYPGSRRTEEVSATLPLFAGHLSWYLQQISAADMLRWNQSEVALLSFLVLVVVALFKVVSGLFIAATPTELKNKVFDSTVLPILYFFAITIYTQSSIRMPGGDMNPLNYIPKDRLLQALSTVMPIILILVLSDFNKHHVARRHNSSKKETPIYSLQKNKDHIFLLALLFLLVSVLISLPGTESFVLALTKKPSILVQFATLLVFIICLLYPFLFSTFQNTRKRSSKTGLAPLLIFSILSTIFINPVNVGLSGIYDSKVSSILYSNSDLTWASDDIFLDAALISHGVVSVSGQQGVGPNEANWIILDPESNYREVWNRGSNYVNFVWGNEGAGITLTNPGPDIIQVTADPCSSSLTKLGLEAILSRSLLSNSCLTQIGAGDWMGRSFVAYKINH